MMSNDVYHLYCPICGNELEERTGTIQPVDLHTFTECHECAVNVEIAGFNFVNDWEDLCGILHYTSPTFKDVLRAIAYWLKHRNELTF